MIGLRLETVKVGPAVEVRDRLGGGLYVFLSADGMADTYGIEPDGIRVDFASHLVVAAHLGPCPTGGYSVRITRAVTGDAGVHITARVARPGPADPVTLAWTYPSHAVALERSALGQADGLEFSCQTDSGQTLRPVRVVH